MSTSDKDIDYSADYRSVYPQKPKAERPRPAEGKPPRRSESGRKARPRLSAAPKTPKEPERPARLPDRMDNESEIDDFLPDRDRADGEQILTRWDGETGKAAAARSGRRRRGRYRYGIFVGSLVLILALVGVVFIASEVGARIHGVLTDDSRLRAYDKFLTVVVAQDPQPFASPDKADPDFVLNASLWKTMTENGSGYSSYDDAGRTIVPLGDVADACRELFGPECSLQPKNPAAETFYTYDSAKAQFHVSLYSMESTYEPYTESVRKDAEGSVLRVGYVPPSDPTRAESGVSSAAGRPKPAKYMEYVLKTDPASRKEYLYAVRKAG